MRFSWFSIIFIFYYYELRSVSTENRFYSVFDSRAYRRTTIISFIYSINSGRRKWNVCFALDRLLITRFYFLDGLNVSFTMVKVLRDDYMNVPSRWRYGDGVMVRLRRFEIIEIYAFGILAYSSFTTGYESWNPAEPVGVLFACV